MRNPSGWQDAEGKLLIYFRKDAAAQQLRYGDRIAFSQLPHEIPEPANPAQFDNRRFLRFHQVNRQVFLETDQWKLLCSRSGNILVDAANRLRYHLLKVFRDHYIDGQDYAVLSALLLGYTDEIDPAVVRAYAVSGALHVLSVSGLHVGIIYIALNMLLFFLNRSRAGKLFKALLILLFLWFYAMITGLQPSVLRSAAMLSFVVIGSVMERRTNMYNTLAASAFLLLAWDPYILTQVGFQLSYLAVIGIVFLYPKIFHLLYVKNRLFKAAWSLTAVSIAAQLATFPLGLYYFHQFPNYFLVSNMLIIPLSTVIIYGGILLLLLNPLTLVAHYLGYVLGLLVHALNDMVMKIETLPHALLDGISISAAEAILIYLVLLGILFFVLYRRSLFLFPALVMGILLFAFNIYEYDGQQRARQFIVFSVPHQSAVDYVDGKQSVLVSDTSLYKNQNLLRYAVRPYWWQEGIDEQIYLDPEKNAAFDHLVIRNCLSMFYDKIILKADSGFYFSKETVFPKIDFLVLSQNTKVRLREILENAKPGQLIIDSSNSIYKDEQWTKIAKELGVPVYSVLRSGAFVYSLNIDESVE